MTTHRKQKWRTYSLRTLLLVTCAIAILLGWYLQRIRTQQRIVRELRSIGANVYSISFASNEQTVISDYPDWIPLSLQFVSPSRKNFVVLHSESYGGFGDDDVALATQLPNLQGLELNFGIITDDSLKTLQGCWTLIDLTLFDTKGYTEQGLQQFQSVRPDCKVSR